MKVDPMRSTYTITEEDHLKCGLSGKTNFSRLYMAKASVQDLKGTPLPRGFELVTQKLPFTRLYWIKVYLLSEILKSPKIQAQCMLSTNKKGAFIGT